MRMAEMMLHIKETTSTNDELNRLARIVDLPEGFCLWSDFQTAGRGQQNNVWVSEAGRNILASVLLRPQHIAIQNQFLISQMVSVGMKLALDKYVEGIRIKWPNDIYWHDRKLGGVLIEHALQGGHLLRSFIGFGLNINQMEFSGAPNPVSLRQITGQHYDRLPVLHEVVAGILRVYGHWDEKQVRAEYMRILYRNVGYFAYEDATGRFEARIVSVEPDGRLLLADRSGQVRGYYMKEVSAVLPVAKR